MIKLIKIRTSIGIREVDFDISFDSLGYVLNCKSYVDYWGKNDYSSCRVINRDFIEFLSYDNVKNKIDSIKSHINKWLYDNIILYDDNEKELDLKSLIKIGTSIISNEKSLVLESFDNCIISLVKYDMDNFGLEVVRKDK